MPVSRRSLILGAGAALIARPALAAPSGLLSRNPFTFPGGVPAGFDPTHPASQGLVAGKGFSCVIPTAQLYARGLASGNRGNFSGGTATTLDGRIGYGMSTTTTGPQFVGSGSLPAGLTFGAIVSGGGGTIISLGSGFPSNNVELFANLVSGHIRPGLVAGSNSTAFTFATAIDSGYNLVTAGVGVYFIACSFVVGVGPVYFVITDMRTGSIFSTSVTSTSSLITPSNTIMILLGDGNAGNVYGQNIAAAMYNPNATPFSALLKWAARPWDFWYPPTLGNFVMEDIGQAGGGGGAPQRTLTGVGK